MPRKNNRKPEIIAALSQKGADPIKVASDFSVTPSYVYHLDKKRREGFASKPVVITSQPSVSGPLFKQLSVSSLKRHGGDVAEEYLRELQSIQGIQLYKEMGNNAVISAVLQAVKMTLRRIQWFGNAPGSGREEEADFLNQCMDDMSITFVDTIDQALSMLQYGFAPFEKVYKVRRGDGAGRPGPKTTTSRYNDGKIGWRKFELIGQDTLAPGNAWIFDEEDGGLAGLNQMPPIGVPYPMGKMNYVAIPIEKMVLFRTTTEKNNPEGRALLRSMYESWFYAKSLTEIEAISAERMGAGFPVVYLGDDVSKGTSADAEIAQWGKVVRNIRVDEMMGVVVPNAKMGSGMAREGNGVLLEFLSPTGRMQVNFGQIIERHEKRMAMVGLAQFIHLGMGQYGSQSLATVTQDFFHLAVGAWADSLRDTFNRFATIPLLQLNHMDTKEPVLIDHGAVSPPNLSEIADYINKTVGAKVIEPDDQLEASIRRLAGFPEKDLETVRIVMNELDGDGGTRLNRSEKTTSDTAGTKQGVKAGQDGKPANQRNMRPKSDQPQESKKPQAKKPMRASVDENEPDIFDEHLWSDDDEE